MEASLVTVLGPATLSGLLGGAGMAALINAWTTRKERQLNAEKIALEIAQLKREERKYIDNEVLGKIAAFAMSEHIYRHLYNVAFHHAKREALVDYGIDDNVRREIQFLADSGFINNLDVWSLKSGDDLTKKLTVTPTGWEYLKLREKAAGRPLFPGTP